MTTPQEEPNDSSAKNEDAANNVPSEITIPSELLAQLPPEVAEALQSNLTSVHGRITSQSLTVQARPFDPIAEKVSPELISEYMGHRARETEQEFAERRHSRLLYSGVGLIVLGALFAFIITLILLRETSLIGPILASIATGATGIGGAGVAIGLAQSHRR